MASRRTPSPIDQRRRRLRLDAATAAAPAGSVAAPPQALGRAGGPFARARTLRRRGRGRRAPRVIRPAGPGRRRRRSARRRARCRTSDEPLAASATRPRPRSRTATPYRRSMSAQRGAGAAASRASRRAAATSASGASSGDAAARRARATSSKTGRSVVTTRAPHRRGFGGGDAEPFVPGELRDDGGPGVERAQRLARHVAGERDVGAAPRRRTRGRPDRPRRRRR